MDRISNPFRYMYRERYPSVGTIYKAWFGKRYLIVKAKALHQSVNMIAKELDQRLRLGVKPNDMFEKCVLYIRRARIGQFEVESILQSDNPVDLLIEEYKLLKASQADENCLNITFFPGLPKWIPETAVAEFQAIVKQMEEKKKAKVVQLKAPKSPGKILRIPKKKINAKSKATKNNKVRSAR